MQGRAMEIRQDDPKAPHVADLLAHHLEELRSVMGEHAQALDASGLSAPTVTFWTVWHGDVLAGFGALKQLDDTHAEVKSMRAAPAARGTGGRPRYPAPHHRRSTQARLCAAKPGDRHGAAARSRRHALPQRRLRILRSFRRLPGEPAQPVHEPGPVEAILSAVARTGRARSEANLSECENPG